MAARRPCAAGAGTRTSGGRGGRGARAASVHLGLHEGLQGEARRRALRVVHQPCRRSQRAARKRPAVSTERIEYDQRLQRAWEACGCQICTEKFSALSWVGEGGRGGGAL